MAGADEVVDATGDNADFGWLVDWVIWVVRVSKQGSAKGGCPAIDSGLTS